MHNYADREEMPGIIESRKRDAKRYLLNVKDYLTDEEIANAGEIIFG